MSTLEQRAQAMISRTFGEVDSEDADLAALRLVRVELASRKNDAVFLTAVSMLLSRAQTGIGRLR